MKTKAEKEEKKEAKKIEKLKKSVKKLLKKLNMPNEIINGIDNNDISYSNFIDYELENKVPIEFLKEEDRLILEKFGIEKAKDFDWELLNSNTALKAEILKFDGTVEEINSNLYETAWDQLDYDDYSARMKEFYKDARIGLSPNNTDGLNELREKFNNRTLTVPELIANWDLFKDRNLSYCIQSDKFNTLNVTEEQLREFIGIFPNLSKVIASQGNIYQTIHIINNRRSEEEKQEQIQMLTDSLLNSTINNGFHVNVVRVSDEEFRDFTIDEYRELLKYSSMSVYMNRLIRNSGNYDKRLLEDLSKLPDDFLFNSPIDIHFFTDNNMRLFINNYGLQNIIDFDNECENCLTRDNCAMLKTLVSKYSYTMGTGVSSKEELYDIISTVSHMYGADLTDFKNMGGEFRRRNTDLFLPEDAPQELQDLFYSRKLTSDALIEHPEYIPYLRDKKLRLGKFFDFAYEKTDFDSAIKFITEYNDVLKNLNDVIDLQNMEFSSEINFNQFQDIICEEFRKDLIIRRKTYPENIPEYLIAKYPSLFLSPDAPTELKKAFYSRELDPDLIISNDSYREFLKHVDPEVVFESVFISKPINTSIIALINQVCTQSEDAFDVALHYSKYINLLKGTEYLDSKYFTITPNITKEELLTQIDSALVKAIIDGKIKYDENISEHFKLSNPTFFLSPNAPQELRDKFYDRKFTLEDFNANLELVEQFGDTNIVLGLPQEFAWITPLFRNDKDSKIANCNRLKIVSEYLKIDDVKLKEAFKEYLEDVGDEFDIGKLDYVVEVLKRLSISNSSEIYTFRKELSKEILKTNDPIDSLSKVEDIFIRNNIPTVGKIYSCFEVLHPNFQGFDLNDEKSKLSPVLMRANNMERSIIIFSDLIKASFGSNNRSVISYLNNIETYCNLYDSIKTGQVQFESLNEEQKNQLLIFSNHLATLYNNTSKVKQDGTPFTLTQDVLSDLEELSKKLSPNGTLDYNLEDRIVKMFCGISGIHTLEQAKSYISERVKMADARNRAAANSPIVINEGDFLKGISKINYLGNILQNGSVSKEFLGSSADSDRTPLDADVSMITKSEGTIPERISGIAAGQYGPIWFILKNDERFAITRTEKGLAKADGRISKLEAFYTGVMDKSHYGIRTGFPSTDIDYILVDPTVKNEDNTISNTINTQLIQRVGVDIAINGFYIPVIDTSGKLVFSPADYDLLREKMSGLSYFGQNDYVCSKNLVTEETEYIASQIEESNREIKAKKQKINALIKKTLDEMGLQLKTSIDGDLTEGAVELIDTGSTGRSTNQPGDGDFDFMMRLDRSIISNPAQLQEFKSRIKKALEKSREFTTTDSGDYRCKGVQIDDETSVDIDITFSERTDKIAYSTDMALQDRLATIQRNDPEKYKYVLANVILAKQVLKKAEVYKPNRGDHPQGGLGGVGIENWVLQNGGSFIDAATSFLQAANGKNFEQFTSAYQVWDFGENHVAAKKNIYPHDNFVSGNMTEEGYKKMVQALKEYVKNHQYTQTDTMTEEGLSQEGTIKR